MINRKKHKSDDMFDFFFSEVYLKCVSLSIVFLNFVLLTGKLKTIAVLFKNFCYLL